MMKPTHRIKLVVWVELTLEGVRVVQRAAARAHVRLPFAGDKLAVLPELAHLGALHLRSEIGISLPNHQHQHCTLHVQQDVLPYALGQLLCPASAAGASIFQMDSVSTCGASPARLFTQAHIILPTCAKTISRIVGTRTTSNTPLVGSHAHYQPSRFDQIDQSLISDSP